MPSYRIHHLKDSLRLQFRQAPHLSGAVIVKPKDYVPAGIVEASNPYAVWALRKEAGQPLQIGDLLEQEGGTLQIYKFIGFEPAQWFVPEPKLAGGETAPLPADGSILDDHEKV